MHLGKKTKLGSFYWNTMQNGFITLWITEMGLLRTTQDQPTLQDKHRTSWYRNDSGIIFLRVNREETIVIKFCDAVPKENQQILNHFNWSPIPENDLDDKNVLPKCIYHPAPLEDSHSIFIVQSHTVFLVAGEVISKLNLWDDNQSEFMRFSYDSSWKREVVCSRCSITLNGGRTLRWLCIAPLNRQLAIDESGF